jgi:hypothetical protein
MMRILTRIKDNNFVGFQNEYFFCYNLDKIYCPIISLRSSAWFRISEGGDYFRPGVFNLYLLKGHILMAERFAGRIHVLQSKVYILLQDMPTNISLHKHTYESFN